jgi:predicted nucleotidyltransferase component of viral defense system
MSPPQVIGLVHSVQTRLKNQAQESGRPFAELLELYAIERFLHRLASSPHRDHFVLKGALLLRHWLGTNTRPTRDIDLLGPVDLKAEHLRKILRDVMRVVVEDDGIEFALDSVVVEPIRAGSTVLGLRAKFDALLGRTRLRYQVDVGLGDAVFPATVDLVAGGLLGMPMASVRAYTPYTTVAEKLEAMVVLGEASSRTKDYYDLVALPQALPRRQAEEGRLPIAGRPSVPFVVPSQLWP